MTVQPPHEQAKEHTQQTSPVGPIGTLSALYVTQAIGTGFLTVGLVSILREAGTSLETLGALQLIGLAWALKFLWAPLVDRFGSRRMGHYRSWVIPLQVGMIMALLALMMVSEPATNLGAVAILAVCYVVFSATQDIAVDAIAVRLIGDSERGPINGIQVASTYVGNLLGGGITVIVYDRFGWAPAMILLAAMTCVGLVAIVLFSEPRAAEGALMADGRPRSWRSMFGVLRQPNCARWALGVVPMLYVGSGIVGGLLSPALIDAGWSLTRVGLVTSVYASIPAVGAGLAAGWLIRTRGRVWVLGAGGILLSLAVLALMPTFVGSAPVGLTTAAVSGFMAAYTVMNVVAYTVMMDYSRPATAGSDFTLMSCLGLGASFVAAAIALAAAGAVGYIPVAIVAVLLIVAASFAGISHLHQTDNARVGS